MRNVASVLIGLALLAGGASNGVVLGAGQATSMVHTHIGHVMTKFQGTPNEQGLLPTALAEAKIAAQHAALAAKTPDNLDAMKLHAGHIIHAVDPSVEMKGPGLGYGVKRAAAGAAQHIQLAAKVEGASKNVQTHSAHVAASANNVVTRADEIVALAQKIRAAISPADAAALVSQLNMLAQELVAGMDANKDGRVTWEPTEGGLQQAQQHMELLVKGEGL